MRLQSTPCHAPAGQSWRQVSLDAFPHVFDQGLYGGKRTKCCICVLPGTELAFANEVCCESWLRPMRGRTLPHRVARFRNVNQDNPCAYHDALEFPGGDIVLLTELREGQHATVLQLPVALQAESKPTQIRQDLPENAVL